MSKSQTALIETVLNGIRSALLGCIRIYQLAISPFIPAHCRFYPTCSHFATEAIHQHGVWAGGKLALKRLASCHPFNEGGYDPVPSCSHKTHSSSTSL